jgi:hypothetical protein
VLALLSCVLTLIGVRIASSNDLAPPQRPGEAEFTFARMIYSANPDFARGWGQQVWMTDAPEAESHFLQGVKRLTRVSAGAQGRAVGLLDDALFDYPFIYAVEVGRWLLSDEEAARLREYLERGGFLVVDDFHGTLEWANFMRSMQRVWPDRPVVELAASSEVFHVLYDVDERIQIPSLAAALSGQTWERDGYVPHWRGIYDDTGRLMVAINFNMDLGDAWEHADTPEYPQPMTALAYRFGINYLLYSMTH